MKQFCHDTRKNYWQLMHHSAEKQEHDDNFFLTAPILNVQTWHDNINAAIERSNRKHKTTFQDIRNFFIQDEYTKNMKKTVKKMKEAAVSGVGTITRTFQQFF